MMIRYLTFVFLLGLWQTALCATAPNDSANWVSLKEVERLSLAVALADYPIPTGKIKEIIGLPEHMPSVQGGSVKGRDSGAYVIHALTDPENSLGFYGPKIVYADAGQRVKDEDVKIQSIEVVFISSFGLQLTMAPDLGWRKHIEMYRQAMKEKHLSPREFSIQWINAMAEPVRSSSD